MTGIHICQLMVHIRAEAKSCIPLFNLLHGISSATHTAVPQPSNSYGVTQKCYVCKYSPDPYALFT